MRVLLADDHQLMLEGLRSVLAAHGIEVVGMATDGLECLAEAREQHPDVILMEVAMPRCDGLRATRLVKSEMPEIQVIMLSATADDHDLFEAVKAGATGFLLKSMDAADLISALKDALCDVPPLAPGLVNDQVPHGGRSCGSCTWTIGPRSWPMPDGGASAWRPSATVPTRCPPASGWRSVVVDCP